MKIKIISWIRYRYITTNTYLIAYKCGLFFTVPETFCFENIPSLKICFDNLIIFLIFKVNTLFCLNLFARNTELVDIWRRVSGLRRDPAVSTEAPTHIHTPHCKTDYDPLVRVLCGLLITSKVRNPRRILPKGSESVFQWNVWIGVESSAETAGSLRNPETRRTPSYVERRDI